MSSVKMISNAERLQNMMASAEIEMFSIINKNGRIVDSLSRNDLRISKEKREILFMQIALQSSMQRDFDEELGTVSFCTVKRKKLKFVYRPIGSGNTALLVMSKNNDRDESSMIDDMCSAYESKRLQEADC
jgi:hypothetical protein